MNELVIAILSGLIGGIVGPVILDEYRQWKKERRWAGPRKKLLRKLLERSEYRSMETLSRVSGTTKDECRTLLIELGARGSKLADNREGWTLSSIGATEDKRSPSMKEKAVKE